MSKLGFATFGPVMLLAALQIGCAATPSYDHAVRPTVIVPRPSCDTSIRHIQLAARIQNASTGDIRFHLDGDRGPPYDPWYMGYRVHSSAPGGPFELVHNSGHDSVWTRTLAIAPGNSAEFNIPVFGLRPADYLRHFRIELRDSKGRSYWTPIFDLCSVSRASCGCPDQGGLAVGRPQVPGQVCSAMTFPSDALGAQQAQVGIGCR